MELTGLKQFANNGGLVTSTLGSVPNSKTLINKQIDNLPGYADGSQLLDLNKFGGSNYKQQIVSPKIDWGNGAQSAMALGQTGALINSFGSKNPINVNTSNQMLSKQIGSTAWKGGGSVNSGGGSGANVGGLVTNGIQFAGDAINAFSTNESGEDIANRQGTSQMSIGGVGYESQNSIDVSKEMDKVKRQNTTNTLALMGSGAALGSVIPGVGTAVGAVIGAGVGLLTGIFGGEARKRKYRRMMEEQNAKINALQNSARYSAQTKAIQSLNAREYGDSETQYLYGAKEGKQPEINPYTLLSKQKMPVITPFGFKIDHADSMVEPGETIFDTKSGLMTQVPRLIGDKPHPGDIQPANIGDAAVFTERHKDPVTGKSFALAAIDGDDNPYNLLYRQKVLVNDKKDNKGLMKAKNGKLPKFENGWLGNAITSGMGMFGGLGQWLEAKNSSSRKTNSYKSNEYELASLDILSKLGVNPFPIMLQLRNAEARSNRAIDMSGGLTSGQRTLQRLASTTSTQRAIADALANILIQNNSYKSDYAKTALATGAANAQRAMQSYQWDEDMYAKAHAARQQGMLMGMRNMIDQLNNYYANEFKRKLFDETMGLYRLDQKLRADEVLAIINSLNNNKNSSSTNYSGVNSISPTYMGDYGLKKDWNIASNSRLKNPKLFWGKDYSLNAPVLPTSYTAYKYIKPYDNIRLR